MLTQGDDGEVGGGDVIDVHDESMEVQIDSLCGDGIMNGEFYISTANTILPILLYQFFEVLVNFNYSCLPANQWVTHHLLFHPSSHPLEGFRSA